MLSSISFCLIFAKAEEIMIAYGRRNAEAKTQVCRAEDRLHGILYEINYNDKILLREGQLDAWIRYVMDNPRRLLVKREHPQRQRLCPFGKTLGKSFDACARGRLLYLGPTCHSNEHKTISRTECLGLNEIARRLCE